MGFGTLEPGVLPVEGSGIEFGGVEIRLKEGQGVGALVEGLGIKGLWTFAIVEDEFSVVIGGEFEKVIVWALDGDRGAREADGVVFPLLLPWKAVYEGDRFREGAIFFLRKFSGLVIVVLNF